MSFSPTGAFPKNLFVKFKTIAFTNITSEIYLVNHNSLYLYTCGEDNNRCSIFY